MGQRRERGAVGAIVLVVAALILITFVASFLLSRFGSRGDERSVTQSRLEGAARAIEQFAAVGRLPCPADPTADTGVEVRLAGNLKCTYPEGTLPWSTIGLSREEARDSWGRKISYRLYTGDNAGNGSLARDQGASMVQCDTVEPAPTIDATRLCSTNADPYLRNTTPALFLEISAGNPKGLTVKDFGTVRTGIAYVLISHGSSGLGGYSVSGARRELPIGDERDNTGSTATFVIKAFSDPDVAVTSNAHFDDLLFFRTISDLAKNANLAARNWPEGLVAQFDRPTVAAAAGVDSASLGADTGQSTLNFGTFTASGLTGGTATNISFDESYGGTPGIGIYRPGSNLMWSNTNDVLRFELGDRFSKFAITLNDFTTFFNGFLAERVQLRFYNDGVLVGAALTKSACTPDTRSLASYTIDVGALFNRVEVQPLTMTPVFFNVPSGLLVSEFLACRATAPQCVTDLATANPTSVCP